MAGVRSVIENLYPELERRLAKVKPDLLIARQGIKLKFNDFQLTPGARLAAAEQRGSDRHRAQTWDERRG